MTGFHSATHTHTHTLMDTPEQRDMPPFLTHVHLLPQQPLLSQRCASLRFLSWVILTGPRSRPFSEHTSKTTNEKLYTLSHQGVARGFQVTSASSPPAFLISIRGVNSESLGPHALLLKLAAAARNVSYNYRKRRAMINSQVLVGAKTLAGVTAKEPCA